MPRPLRLEYEGAFHHVMNRGRNHQTIFHDDRYFAAFITTLQEASERYNAVIHAYCLMTNHYHLLIETPKANLSQIMQHINGKYTQRYNRMRGNDGTLFRGRYKSVLVDEDSYLLQLSRYIHRNPLEVKRRMIEKLEDYRWSSYSAYINQSTAPKWLMREKTYQKLGQKQRYRGYQIYVEKGVDEDIKRFYGKDNILGVLGDKEYRETKRDEVENADLLAIRAALQDKPSMKELLQLVSELTGERASNLKIPGKKSATGSGKRAFAIYVCKTYSSATYKAVADFFNLTHVGSVCYPLARIKREIKGGSWKREVKRIEKRLCIVKYT